MNSDADESKEHSLIAQRRQKLADLREAGDAFPNDFRRDVVAADLHTEYDSADNLAEQGVRVAVAGRMMAKRVMGKASFAQVQDMSGQIQLFLQRDALGTETYTAFKQWDIGDIVGAEGTLFHTKTGELTVSVERLQLLTKSLRPLPEKWHGLSDQEQRYRQRYVDLTVNPDVREIFRKRSGIVAALRNFLVDEGFLEVETPMMQPIPGGAAAKPFVTHHNALGVDLYLRIAPELYLKRLLVGGLDRVFEINRSFRNEGLSPRHNPEFTMLEAYEAYADYRTGMDRTEAMLKRAAAEVLGTRTVATGDAEYDLDRPFARMSLREAVRAHNPELADVDLDDRAVVAAAADRQGVAVQPDWGPGKIETELFEKTVEPKLHDPTFITHLPTEVSPLARQVPGNPAVTERFELFIGGRELANGFSELNDPEEQAARFRDQVEARDAGDAEAMHFDADYIRALEYGMPPASGIGLGIDRVVMLFTGAASIREVVLFPQLRPTSED